MLMRYTGRIRRTVALVVICTLLFSIFPVYEALAKGSSDIDGHWAETALREWMEKGWISGYPDGSVRPDRPITRAEWIALIHHIAPYREQADARFTDMSSDAWYVPAVSAAVAAGYITGYEDGTLKPDDPISRQEAAVILSRVGADRLEKDREDGKAGMAFRDEIPAWSAGRIQDVVAMGWMQGYPDGTFGPQKQLTRAEAVVSLDRLAKAVAAKDQDEAQLRFDQAGTYGPSSGERTVEGDVVIAAAGVTLQNTRIKGSLTIAESVGEGSVALQGVTAEGETVVRGGGRNSVEVKDSKLEKLTVRKQGAAVRIAAIGETSIAETIVHSDAILEENDLTGQGFVSLRISEDMPKEGKVLLRGNFDNVFINGSNLRIELLTGNIMKLEAAKGVTGVIVYLAKGTTVEQAILHAGVTIIGEGIIKQGRPGPSSGSSTSSSSAPDSSLGPGKPKPSVTGYVYTPESIAFTGLDEQIRIALTERWSDGTSRDVTADASWSSGDESIAKVDAGLVTSSGSGTTRIAVKYGDFTASITVSVEAGRQPTVTGYVYAPESIAFADLGWQRQITLTEQWSDGTSRDVTADASWSSGDENVATVEAGRVAPIGNGATYITVEYGEFTASIPVSVDVIEEPTVTGYEYIPNSIAFAALGLQLQITLTEQWSDGTSRDVTAEAFWSSGDESIAMVGAGLVTSVGDGMTEIAVTYGDFNARIPVTVTSPGEYMLQLSVDNVSPQAGAASTLRFAVRDKDGQIVSHLNGRKTVKLSGMSAAPDGSFGAWNGAPIASASPSVDVEFTNGVAEAQLALHHAMPQILSFTVEGVSLSAMIVITPTVSDFAQLQIATQPSGAVQGKAFDVQPVIRLTDAYGNLTQFFPFIVQAQVSEGNAALIGMTTAIAMEGIAAFADLGLTGDASEVVLSFTAGNVSVRSNPIPVKSFDSGSGTETDPYVIKTAAQLDRVRDHLNASFVLGADIDFAGTDYYTGTGWSGIGSADRPFTGSFDGRNHAIRNLFIDNPGGISNIGLFGVTAGQARIQNLRLVGVNVKGGMNSSSLISVMGGGTVKNVHVQGVVKGDVFYTGGLIGIIESGAVVQQSSADIRLDSMNVLAAGGLAGVNSGTISQSFAIGRAEANHREFGGLVGSNYGTIENSYSTVEVVGGTVSVGGLAGNNESGGRVINSYAAGLISSSAVDRGGLIGTNSGSVTDSYYDQEVSKQSDTGKGTPKTTAEMKKGGTFAGWLFPGIWGMKENQTYPYLQWELTMNQP